MKRTLAAFGFVVVALGVFAITDSASAKDSILNSFTTTYPATAGTTLDNCSTCHTSVPALNAYGAALRATGLNFSAIEGLDSDGDGVTNLTEIRNLTGPGNVAAFPTTTTTPTSTTSTTNTTNTTNTTSAASTTPTTPTTRAATPPAAAPSASAGAASSPGAEAFDAGPAGMVWLAIVDGRLVVTQVESDWNYSQESEDDDDREIEIKFRSGDQEVEFEAELEDGAIRTKVNMESGDDHDDDGGFDDHGEDHSRDVKGDDHGSDDDDDRVDDRDDDHGEHEDD